MTRMQIQLTESQNRALRRWARRLGISYAEAVRRCVAERLAREEREPSHEERVRAALAVCGKYKDPDGLTNVAEEHDKYAWQAGWK